MLQRGLDSSSTGGREALVGFGLLQLGQDQASELPSPAPYQPFDPFQLLSCLCLQAHSSIRLPFQWLCFNALSQVDCQTFSVERINSNPQNQPTAIVWIRNFSLDQQSHNQISCHYCGCLSSSMFLTKITILEWSNVTFSSWDAVSRFATRPSSLLSCFTFGKRSAQGWPFWVNLVEQRWRIFFQVNWQEAERAPLERRSENQDEVAFRFHWPLNLQWHIQGIELKWKTLRIWAYLISPSYSTIPARVDEIYWRLS